MRERKLDKRRLGRCYDLAAHRLLDRFEDDSSARLVHGTFEDYPYPAIPHAWIEYVVEDAKVYDDKFEEMFDGRYCWEPVSNQSYPAMAFYAMHGATAHNSYTFRQTCIALSATRHYGPWEGDYWKLETDKGKTMVAGRRPLKHSVPGAPWQCGS